MTFKERLLKLQDKRMAIIFDECHRSQFGDNHEAMRDAGISYAIDQIIELAAHGVDGVHIYTMNDPYVARRISEGVKNILKSGK